ncbi:hypothetical protein ES702_04391 [subsurface metagenome]
MKKNKGPEEISPEEKKKMETKELPPFPERKKGDSPPIQEPEEKEDYGPGADEALPDDIVNEICKDLVNMGGQMWHIVDPVIPELEPTETKMLYKPLARMAQKYKVGKYLKDEILFIGGIIFVVSKRLRIKKNADHDRGEKGEGKDKPSEETHPI